MRIFLSSTYVDLKEIRKVAITYLEGIMGHVTDKTGTVVAMEFFNATERFCKEECLHELSTCDLVIGIYGDRYGRAHQKSQRQDQGLCGKSMRRQKREG